MTITTIGILLLVIALIVSVAFIFWLRQKSGRKARRRSNRAVQGEHEAEMFLKQRGFKILDRQLRRQHSMLIDGEQVSFEVRADLLVRKRFKTYIAEVKTGQLAPDPSAAQTRRQLLEYSLIFQEYGLLLVDMESKLIREITFPE